MSKLINLNLSSDECVELAHKVYESGDKNQAIIYLKDALKENERNSQAIHFLAQIYSEYNMYVLSNALLYRGLALHVDEDPKELYSKLSYNFMGLKFTQALVYYLKKMDLPFLEDVDQIEVEEETDVPYLKGFKLGPERIADLRFHRRLCRGPSVSVVPGNRGGSDLLRQSGLQLLYLGLSCRIDAVPCSNPDYLLRNHCRLCLSHRGRPVSGCSYPDITENHTVHHPVFGSGTDPVLSVFLLHLLPTAPEDYRLHADHTAGRLHPSSIHRWQR